MACDQARTKRPCYGLALIIVACLGIWLKISYKEWAILAVAAGGVIAAEALNTAIEWLADRVSREQEESIRLVKDVAAGGVLAAAGGQSRRAWQFLALHCGG